jgi:serine/threonine protein kinase
MAKKLKVGDVIRGYRVTKVIGPGMMAISYAAQAPTGAKVFLKQYKSPAPTVVWYDAFSPIGRSFQSVKNGKAAHFAVHQVDAFEETWGGLCYFQAYEFVEAGADLQQTLDEGREQYRRTKSPVTSDPSVWARHITWAKVFMAGIAALDESKIVHADLKPANAYLIKDPTIGSGFQLKLIDMDFSLLVDKRAPWHGFQGYVGTDNYRSPEHLIRGSVPGLHSDVFTCGLILYELLAGYHPYWSEDQAEYAKRVQAHAAKPPALLGVMSPAASNADVSSALYRCLSPDLEDRPTAGALRAALSGRGEKLGAPAAGLNRKASAKSPGGPIMSDSIELSGPDGSSLRVGVRTELGKGLVRQFGPDGEFWDNRQCVSAR